MTWACILIQITIYGRFVEMIISTNLKPVIYRNLYENIGPELNVAVDVAQANTGNLEIMA